MRGVSAPLRGELRVPGDKSIGHRALLLAGLAAGKVRIRGISGGEDNLRSRRALEALGVTVVEVAPGELEVGGRGLDGLTSPAGELDCGNSGTTMRLLCGLLAPRYFSSRLVGDRYLSRRPMRRVIEPLERMGARIGGGGGEHAAEVYAPLTIAALDAGARLRGIHYRSPMASAQVKSAVLLAGLLAEGSTTVSEPALSRDHTERMLTFLGAPLERHGLEVTVAAVGWARRLEPRDLEVPGDLSSAAFLLGAAALVPGSQVTLRGVGSNPTRTGFIDALRAMEGAVEISPAVEKAGEPIADLTARASSLRGTEISGELTVRAIDELPLLAALAAHAGGTTVIAGAAELRVKESDRVQATAAMLRAFGVDVEERPDGLRIAGGGARAGVVESHGDHRIAMAGAVCALAAPGRTVIRDVDNVATSFPGFASALAQLGADVEVRP